MKDLDQQGRLLHTLTGHTKSVNTMAYDAGGRLAPGSNDRTATVRIRLNYPNALAAIAREHLTVELAQQQRHGPTPSHSCQVKPFRLQLRDRFGHEAHDDPRLPEMILRWVIRDTGLTIGGS